MEWRTALTDACTKQLLQENVSLDSCTRGGRGGHHADVSKVHQVRSCRLSHVLLDMRPSNSRVLLLTRGMLRMGWMDAGQ